MYIIASSFCSCKTTEQSFCAYIPYNRNIIFIINRGRTDETNSLPVSGSAVEDTRQKHYRKNPLSAVSLNPQIGENLLYNIVYLYNTIPTERLWVWSNMIHPRGNIYVQCTDVQKYIQLNTIPIIGDEFLDY